MIYLVVCFIISMIGGFFAFFTTLMWAWNWFGDIWHTNNIADMWYIPFFSILILNAVIVIFILHRRTDKKNWRNYLSALSASDLARLFF